MIAKITGLLVLVGIIFSAYFVIDKRYALSETVKLIEQRLDQKITSDQYNETQKRIWAIEDRYSGKVIPETVKEELRELLKQKELIKSKLQKEDN